MPLTKQQIKSSYPLPAYNYRVTIYGSDLIAGAAGAAMLGFSEISGLTVKYEHVVYRHGLSYLTGPSIIRGKTDPVQVTMKRGMVHNGSRDFFYKWLASEDKF